MVKIVVLSGPMDGQEFRTGESLITLGKDEHNNISLSLDPQISQDHARITFEAGRYWLEDLQSANGTFIDGQRIKFKVTLNPVNTFRMGRTLLRLSHLSKAAEDRIICKCGVKNTLSEKWCKNCGRELKSLIKS